MQEDDKLTSATSSVTTCQVSHVIPWQSVLISLTITGTVAAELLIPSSMLTNCDDNLVPTIAVSVVLGFAYLCVVRRCAGHQHVRCLFPHQSSSQILVACAESQHRRLTTMSSSQFWGHHEAVVLIFS